VVVVAITSPPPTAVFLLAALPAQPPAQRTRGQVELKSLFNLSNTISKNKGSLIR